MAIVYYYVFSRIIRLKAGQIKRHNIDVLYKISQFFLTYERYSEHVKAELDLSSYEGKAHLKRETDFDTSNSAAKVYLASLKADVDKIDIDVVGNDVVKKCVW